MKTFGDTDIEWKESGETHVLVAVKVGWGTLCRAFPSEYETVEPSPKPTTDPVVWRHDRAKVSCRGCLAVLDGAVVQRVPVST